MAEGPNKIPHVVSTFLKIPYRKIYFITIKDNSRKKFQKMDQVKTWVRRYSDLYCIVRGLENGIHFHILMSTDSKKILPVKGVHFHIENVKSGAVNLYKPNEICIHETPPHTDMIIRLARYGANNIVELMAINRMILHYHRDKEIKEKRNEMAKIYRRRSLDRKYMTIARIYDYIIKNKNENSVDDLEFDYYFISNFNGKKFK